MKAMISKTNARLAIAGAVLGALTLWQRPAPAEQADNKEAHSITLPAMQPDLPPGPNRDTVAGTCAVCHTTRYITMQPAFTRSAWTAEVDKMRKTFGAPLTDAQAAQVVEYLVAVRGK
jgi:mono/diheme cytochrome c family protein